jgi:hypothetical protein
MGRSLFLLTRGDRETFHTVDELRELTRSGLVARGDLVYHPTLGRWLYAHEVEEVKLELSTALTLGQPQALAPAELVNSEAVAGFILGLLGYLPLFGLLCCLCGIYFSERGLKRASELGNRGQALAVAGLVLSLAFLVPAAACDAMFLAALGPLF